MCIQICGPECDLRPLLHFFLSLYSVIQPEKPKRVIALYLWYLIKIKFILFIQIFRGPPLRFLPPPVDVNASTSHIYIYTKIYVSFPKRIMFWERFLYCFVCFDCNFKKEFYAPKTKYYFPLF